MKSMRNWFIVVALAGSIAQRGVAQSVRLGDQPPLELSCGRFNADMTEADLRVLFGAENVVRAGVVGFDDGPQPGAVIFPEDPEARVEVVWRDPDSHRAPALILVRETAHRWQTPTGVALGMDLRSLERANGRPFRLRGLRAEGGIGGAVLSWAGGRLESPATQGCELGVYLQPAYDGTEPRVMRQVLPGREFSSGHPAFQELNPRVVALTLWFR